LENAGFVYIYDRNNDTNFQTSEIISERIHEISKVFVSSY